MGARIGEPCYGKAVPGAYGSVVMGRVRDDVKEALGKVIERAIRDALLRHVGIDLVVPDDEVLDGDRVLLPGGMSEDLPDGQGYSSEDVDNMIEVLGISSEDINTGDTGALAVAVARASALRVRLGGALQTLTGDGCDDFAEGVRGLEGIVKQYNERTDKGDSITEFLEDAPNQTQLCELFAALGVDWEAIGSTPESLALATAAFAKLDEEARVLRSVLIAFTGRDPGTDLSAAEILQLVLDDYSRECERRQATQDRVQALLLRLVGTCGEGLTAETMLDQIEASLGPVPEF